MKKVFADVVTSFLAEQGYQFRYYGSRWWQLREGHWYRVGRVPLEQTLTLHMRTFWPKAYDSMNWSDMNQMCAFLALALGTSALPGASREPGQDPKLFRPGVMPHITAGRPEQQRLDPGSE